VLAVVDPERAARLSQVLVLGPEQRTLGLTVEVSSEGVVPGDLSWQTAIVYLIGRNPAGKFLRPHLEAAVLSGDNPWKKYSGTLILPKQATDAVFVAALSRATGVLRIRNVRIFPVQEAMAFRIGFYALLAAWAIAALFIVPAVGRGLRSTAARALTGLAALAILVAVLIPYSLKSDIFRPLEDEMRTGQSLLPALPPDVDRFLGLAINQTEKFAHSVFFFAAAMIVRVFQREGRVGVQFGLLLLFAGVTEALQYFTPTRTPSVHDWLWDAGGISLAFLLSWCFGISRMRRRA
jgi:hypothetical protein